MTLTESLLLRRLYDAERQCDQRNYAMGHSFEEWVNWLLGV